MDEFLASLYIVEMVLAVAYAAPLIAYGLGVRRVVAEAGLPARTEAKAEFQVRTDANLVRRAASERVLPDLVPFVSVIVAARNEEVHARRCLSSLLESQYPSDRFEIIFIDDHSTDRTLAIAETMAAEWSENREIHRSLKVVSMAKRITGGHSSKKAALGEGISLARGEIIALTDADCVTPQDWLPLMVDCFDSNTGFVAGPVAFTSDGSRFSDTVALEFMGLAGICAGSIGIGKAATCSGASIAFRRTAFVEVNGYEGLEHLQSGDDEMLMHRIAAQTTWSIRYCASQAAIVRTNPPETIKDFLRQRARWASKAMHYEKARHTAMYVLVYLFVLSLPLIAIGSFFLVSLWPLLLLTVGVKIGAERCVLRPAATFFQGGHLLRYHIPAQPFHIVYVLWVGMVGVFGRFEWKDRRSARQGA